MVMFTFAMLVVLFVFGLLGWVLYWVGGRYWRSKPLSNKRRKGKIGGSLGVGDVPLNSASSSPKASPLMEPEE